MVVPSVMLLLALVALVFCILAVTDRLPLWAAVLILCVIELIQAGLGLGK